jgi:hypothetical protein
VDVAGTVVDVAVDTAVVVDGVVGATVDAIAVVETAVEGIVVSIAAGVGDVVEVGDEFALHADKDSRSTAIAGTDRPTGPPLAFPSSIST